MNPLVMLLPESKAALAAGLLHGAGGWIDFWAELLEEVFPAGSATFDPVGALLLYGPLTVAAILGIAASAAAVRAVVWRWRHTRLTEGAHLVEVAVPPVVEEGSAAAWWSHLVGLTAPRWKRAVFGQPHLGFELVADSGGVRFQIWVPGATPPALIDKTVRAAWPGATVTTRPATRPIPLGAASAGGRLVLGRTDHYPLKTSHDADPLRAMLTALEGLREGEYAAVQILARPVTGRRRLGRAHRAAAALRGGRSTAPQAAVFDLLTPGSRAMTGHLHAGELARMYPERAEEVRAILGKAAQPRYEVQITYTVATTRHQTARQAPGLTTDKTHELGTREGAETGHTPRSVPGWVKGWLDGYAHELAATFALYTSGHQFLRRDRLRQAAARLASRRMGRSYLLSVDELAALAHLPYDLNAPGVTRAGARPVAPSPVIPSGGPGVRLLGDAETGQGRPVGVSVAGARQHVHVMGQTGVGKSTFLAHQILADAYAGRGVLVIDPKGDLIIDLLDRLPERAVGKTVVFDPAQDGPPPCFNVLAGPDPVFATESIVTTFRRCFAAAWGARMDDLMRSACLTLASVNRERATLADVPRLLSDDTFRARTLARLGDPLLRGFWQSYDELSPGARAAVIAPVMNKLRAVLLRPFIRDALSGQQSTVHLGRVLNTGGLVLARLPKGVLGDDAARLFGSLLLAHTWQAITPRAHQPEHQRRDAAAYVDEAHNFLNLPGSISDVLAEARAYRFGLVLAHQHLSQLPKDLRDAVSADTRNKIYFTLSPEDAADTYRHLAPQLSAHDLSHLGGYQAAGRIIHDGKLAPPFTFTTRPLPDPIEGRAAQVRAASRHLYATGRQQPATAWAFDDDTAGRRRLHWPPPTRAAPAARAAEPGQEGADR